MNGTDSDSEGLSAHTATPPESVPPTSARNRTMLIVAALVAAVWVLGLVVLALISANPVTLNEEQILHSLFVVTAIRPDAKSSMLLVTKEWLHGEDLGEIAVANLDHAKMPADRECLVPLQRLGKGRYQITPTTLPNEAPLIYPATPEAEAQLRELLKAGLE